MSRDKHEEDKRRFVKYSGDTEKNKGERKKKQIREKLVESSRRRRRTFIGIKEALEEGGVLPDVNEKSLGRPASRSLYNSWRHPMFCESGGTTGPHGLASNVLLKEEAQPGNEERAGRDFSSFCEPERGSNWMN